MSESVKESKEVLEAALKVAIVIIKQAKDGLQAKDVVAVVAEILASEDLKAAISEAVEGIQKVPAEMSDLQAQEIVELVVLLAMKVPEVLEALKK
jgi:hypothetical protein